MKTRFAPSPTGLLHLGHVYAAKFAFDLAREHGGSFLLRFEDIDTTRVREKYYAMIEEDLVWLGFSWQGSALRQVDRLDAYTDALQRLKSLGVVYPCFCTRREIQEEMAAMAHAPHGPEGPLYPGICKSLSSSEREQRLARGDSHCWRLDAAKVSDDLGPLFFEDVLHGSIEMDLSLLGDVVLARKDIATSYHLAVVVDDAAQEVTDVTRGEDLLASTHVHRALQSLLDLPVPRYHHHRLICDEEGKRLAKRDEALSVRHLREQGKTPEEVLQEIALHLLYTQD
ncbi:tRNA glutamyl-Q(34) synthetase GluQRS [Verrucomicrobiaceae bacterium N1E253]|uniref:tRNA glutamyl-Q(34) synthetase GluQRS n=1 Tax=Oceaniferula marina TaxID=2748318 RepID=A0A851GK45_9BACT|nr:tRNA glutamyl-Q(34) synthetase GluQRS [Oceaniferula marina]NWK57529.1 tRNA glutamyl-Q(34) synthetase GluQRS [Oceaniferula marina]